jgi:parvulin-like peptidyl-prolyl isomerase
MNADAATDQRRSTSRAMGRRTVAVLRVVGRHLPSCAGIVFLCGMLVAIAAAQESRKGSEGRAGKGAPTSTGDRTVVAQVNDKPIYKGDVDQALAALLRAQNISPSADPKPEHQAAVLDLLIGQRLYVDYIERNDELKASAEELKKIVDDMGRQLREKQRISLEQYARQRGLTKDALVSQIAIDLSRQKLVQKYDTPEWVEPYFKQHARHFDGTQLRVSHILLRPKGNGNENETRELRAKAEQIKAEIESGKFNFAEAARQYSAGPSRQEGGDLGFIGRAGPMVEEFNKAAFDLEQGKISDPVVSTFGVHLITVTEVKPGDKSLELVRDQVMPAFAQWLMEQLIANERKTAKIEFNESFPHFKPGTRELSSAEK